MDTGKLLTVIVPTYNVEDYLPKCLSSLVVDDDELMGMLEVIVVIDGSTDRCSEIAHGYEKQYPGVFCVIDKENGNYGSCINSALKVATGKYVKTVDADDYVDTENFKEFLKVLSKSDADAVLHYAVEIDSDGNEGRGMGVTRTYFARFGNESTVFSLRELVENGFFRPIMHNTTYRTSILRDMNYVQLEGIFYTDTQWMFLPMTKVDTVALFPKVVYYYQKGRVGQSVSKDVRLAHFNDEFILRKQLAKEYIEYDGTETGREYLRKLFKEYLEFVYRYALEKDFIFRESDIRRLDKMLRDMGYPHYEEMSSWRIPCYAYRHSVTVGFWRKWDGRWFYLLEGTLKFFWDPYKKIKKWCGYGALHIKNITCR